MHDVSMLVPSSRRNGAASVAKRAGAARKLRSPAKSRSLAKPRSLAGVLSALFLAQALAPAAFPGASFIVAAQAQPADVSSHAPAPASAAPASPPAPETASPAGGAPPPGHPAPQPMQAGVQNLPDASGHNDAPAPPPATTQNPATTQDPAVKATLPPDLSAWGMYRQADVVVKAVMIGLAFASLVTWTIGLAKALELAAARPRTARALRGLHAASSLHEASHNPDVRGSGVVASIVAAAVDEEERSAGLAAEGVKERVAIAMTRIEAAAGRAMGRGTGMLATIGSTAPFVGLFGTVWGIMNSFIGIAASRTTNLAVVAPGIAEALLATAIGLVAAIPAVIIYNVFSRSIAGYRALLSDASALALRHLSRDLDRRDSSGNVTPLRRPAE